MKLDFKNNYIKRVSFYIGLIGVFIYLQGILCARDIRAHPSSSFFFVKINPQVAENCVPILIDMIKSSNYDFGRWMPDATLQEVKDVVSFWWDKWNDSEISIKLFFDWIDDPGTGTMTWMRYDFKKEALFDIFPDETLLHYDKGIEKRFLACIKKFEK